MKIRQASVGDKQAILSIANSLYLEIPGFVWNSPEFVERQINRGEYFLAEHDNQALGIISLRRRKNKLYIETLVVKKEHQSNGVGKQMVAFARDAAKEKGLSALCACSFPQYNIVDFYVSQGFSLLNCRGTYNRQQFYRLEMKTGCKSRLFRFFPFGGRFLPSLHSLSGLILGLLHWTKK